MIFGLFGHETLLLGKEVEYFSILSYSIVFLSLRTSFAGFFIGVERTKVVTLATFSAVFVNIPLTYVLVFGKLGFPNLGISGAAIGTVVSGIFPILILAGKFYSKEFRNKYATGISIRIHLPLLKKTFKIWASIWN